MDRFQADRTDPFTSLFLDVYPELRREAGRQVWNEMPSATLQPTALVNDVYLCLARKPRAWNDAPHVLKTASRVMRHLLVDRARKRSTLRQGSGRVRVPLEEHDTPASSRCGSQALDLDEALLDLVAVDSGAASVVRLRYYYGLTVDETARTLQVSPRKVNNDWNFAKAWLRRRLE